MEGKASVLITQKKGKEVSIQYFSKDISPYTVIGVLRRLIHDIEEKERKTSNTRSTE